MLNEAYVESNIYSTPPIIGLQALAAAASDSGKSGGSLPAVILY